MKRKYEVIGIVIQNYRKRRRKMFIFIRCIGL